MRRKTTAPGGRLEPGMPTNHNLIRVLIADDEAKIRDAYREVFEDPKLSSSRTMIQNLRDKVLGASQTDPSAKTDASRRTRFELVFCDGAESAVAAATPHDRASHRTIARETISSSAARSRRPLAITPVQCATPAALAHAM